MHSYQHFTTTTHATVGNDETAYDRDRMYIKREKLSAEWRYRQWSERRDARAEQTSRDIGALVVCLLLAAVGSAIAGGVYAWFHPGA